MMKSLIRLNPERKNTREYQLQNVTATVAYCSSGIVTQPYTCWLINIVSVLTSHSGSVAFRGVAVLFPLPVRPNLPAVVRFSPRLPGLLVQSLLAVKCTASWTTCSGLRLGVPACVFEC
ncbi:unnamed protein product [Boreogadus saida]